MLTTDTRTPAPFQAPGLFLALRLSYHLPTSATLQAAAMRLAPTVRTLRPGVFQIGASQVDLWRKECTCKAHRQHRRRPCAHLVALYLVGEWLPIDPDPMQYLKTLGVKPPTVTAIYCRCHVPPLTPAAPAGFRVIDANKATGRADLLNLATGTHLTVSISQITHLWFIYAD